LAAPPDLGAAVYRICRPMQTGTKRPGPDGP
jgi:hypothetical protein